jgi:hypothetical protein
VAGIIVADTIQSGGDFIRLNSASQTVATINARGIYANTGNLLIAANGTIGVASITNTAITGTLTQAQIGNGVTTTGPAFSAYMGSSQTLTSAVWTKLQFNTESIDTASCYDPTTNYRFTPNVAGYYQINLGIYGGANTVRAVGGAIYKNGSVFIRQTFWLASEGDGDDVAIAISKLVYMNGTTDYIEPYGYVYDSVVGTDTIIGSGVDSWFEGFLARAA